jgi:hypothetical protein
MAKKASKSKRASSQRKRKVSSKGRKRLTVPVQSVVHFVKMLYDQNHAEKFIASAKRSKAIITMHADSIEFVKKFLAKNQLRRATAASVVDPCPGDPFECFDR